MKNDGRLTEESFAVAMHLINQVLTGKLLPDTLPVSLVPPSFRSELGMPPAVQQGPVVSETQKDLFGLFEEAALTSAPVQSQHTGSIAFQPEISGTMSTAPSFGTFPMPAPVPIPAAAPAPQGLVKDLLGDDDEVIERTTHQISSTSAEMGNTQNQLNQTATAYETAKTEREKLEAELASHAATLSQLQTQLASAKAGYEAESKLLATLRERYNTQLTEIQATRTQLITAESDLSALKLEKTEVGGALLRDKEDVRELQRRHKDVLEEVENVKKEVEKAKKDVRLQKGLLAIAKKQLASAEGDKAAAEKELEETKKEAEAAEGELRVAEVELALRPQSPSLGTAQVSGPAPDGTKTPSVRATSPVPSIRSTTSRISAPTATLPFQDASSISTGNPGSSKSNNPFERLALSRSNSNSPFQAASPPPAQPAAIPNAEADDPFGFNAVPSTATITAVETVSPQNTGGMGVPTPESDTTINTNVNHAPQGSFAESDAYFTPPSSTETERKDTVVAVALSQFPDLTEPGVPAPPVTANPADGVDEPIDINLPPLTEIKEADDSSDDSDEDEADFEAARTAVKAEVSSAPAPDPPTQPMAESLHQLQPPAPVNAGAAAFDDLFGVSPATSNTATTAGSDFSNISANPQQAPVAQNGSAFPSENFFDSMTSAATPATPAPTNGRCLSYLWRCESINAREQVPLVLRAHSMILWGLVQTRKLCQMARRSSLTRLSTKLSTSTHSLHLNRPKFLGLLKPQRMKPAHSQRLGLPQPSLSMMYLELQILRRIRESKLSRYRLTMPLTLDLLSLSRNCDLLPRLSLDSRPSSSSSSRSLLSRSLLSRCLNHPPRRLLLRFRHLHPSNTRRLQVLRPQRLRLHHPKRLCPYDQHHPPRLSSQLRSACNALRHQNLDRQEAPDRRDRWVHNLSLRRPSIHDLACSADQRLRRRKKRVERRRMVKVEVGISHLCLLAWWETGEIPRVRTIWTRSSSSVEWASVDTRPFKLWRSMTTILLQR